MIRHEDDVTSSSLRTIARQAHDQLRALCEETWIAHRDETHAEYNQCEKDECCWCQETREALHRLLSSLTEEPRTTDHGAGLIGQTIPDVDGTLPRPNGDTYEAILRDWREQDKALQEIADLCDVGIDVMGVADVVRSVREFARNAKTDPLRASAREQDEEPRTTKNHGAGLIHQPIPDMADPPASLSRKRTTISRARPASAPTVETLTRPRRRR